MRAREVFTALKYRKKCAGIKQQKRWQINNALKK